MTSAHRKVLIIEDDGDIRSLVNLRLRQQPDVVLLDLGVPPETGTP